MFKVFLIFGIILYIYVFIYPYFVSLFHCIRIFDMVDFNFICQRELNISTLKTLFQ